MKQWYIVMDVRWCMDCNNCLMSCKDEHVLNDWPGYTKPQPRHGHRWVNVLRRERGRYARNDYIFLPLLCQHCEICPVVNAGFAYRREDGIVMIDMEKAKGHREVVDMCPYGTVYYNDEECMPQKCTLCAHLLDDPDWAPGVPRCVQSCPNRALQAHFLEPEEIEAMIEEKGLEIYRPELGTHPHMFYENLHKFTKNFIWGGVTKDGDCVENATIELKRDGEVLASQQTNFFGDFKFDGLEDGQYVVCMNVEGQTKDLEVEIAGKSLNLDYTDF